MLKLTKLEGQEAEELFTLLKGVLDDTQMQTEIAVGRKAIRTAAKAPFPTYYSTACALPEADPSGAVAYLWYIGVRKILRGKKADRRLPSPAPARNG